MSFEFDGLPKILGNADGEEYRLETVEPGPRAEAKKGAGLEALDVWLTELSASGERRQAQAVTPEPRRATPLPADPLLALDRGVFDGEQSAVVEPEPPETASDGLASDDDARLVDLDRDLPGEDRFSAQPSDPEVAEDGEFVLPPDHADVRSVSGWAAAAFVVFAMCLGAFAAMAVFRQEVARIAIQWGV